MNTASHTPVRRRALTAAGIATGLALVVATPLMASAHVHVDPSETTAGGTQTLTFSFSHGCDGSPTTALVIDIPDAVATAKPVVDGAWSISQEVGDDGIPSQLTYSALTPIEDGFKATVSVDVLFSEDAADTEVPFPLTQECTEGETAWVEVAEDGQDADSLEAPAPVVTVGAFVEDAGHGHSDSTDATEDESADGHADGDGDHAAGATDAETAASGTTGTTAALWLSGAALAASIAALIVALVRGRARNA